MSIFIHDETKDTIHPVTDDSHVSVHWNTVRINPVGTTIAFNNNDTAKRFLTNLATAIADREPIYLLKAEEINGEAEEHEENPEKPNEFIGLKSEDDLAAEAEAERLAKEEASEEEAKELAKERKKPSKAKSEVENDK